MKVKTFNMIVTVLFLLAMLAIAHYAHDIRPDASSVAATEVPDKGYSASTTPELLPNMTLPDINESSLNLTPMTLSENSNKIVTPTIKPTAITPIPSTNPSPTPMAPMAPMKPMEPWKPAAPMAPL